MRRGPYVDPDAPPIVQAAQRGEFETVKRILSGDSLALTATDSDFPLVMHCLSRYTEGSRSMLEYLLENGADPNVTYKPEGWIALTMAVNNGQEENVRLLVKHGAKLDLKDRNGETSLKTAKRRLADCKDPKTFAVHGEFSDPKVRQAAIDRWESMVKLLIDLEGGP